MALDVHVNVAARMDAPDLPGEAEVAALLERAVRAALAAHGIDDAQMSVTVLDDEDIAGMNERYLEHEGPTDVISFGLGPEGGAPIGDIYIGGAQALRQATALGVALREELVRLAVHGTLHVLGYDHPEGEERERSEMWERQEAIVREVLRP